MVWGVQPLWRSNLCEGLHETTFLLNATLLLCRLVCWLCRWFHHPWAEGWCNKELDFIILVMSHQGMECDRSFQLQPWHNTFTHGVVIGHHNYSAAEHWAVFWLFWLHTQPTRTWLWSTARTLHMQYLYCREEKKP